MNWKCPQCGKRNMKDDTTCLRCGYDVPLKDDGTPDWKATKKENKHE